MLAGAHRGEILSGLFFLFRGGRGKVRQIAFRGDLLFSYYGLFWLPWGAIRLPRREPFE